MFLTFCLAAPFNDCVLVKVAVLGTSFLINTLSEHITTHKELTNTLLSVAIWSSEESPSLAALH